MKSTWMRTGFKWAAVAMATIIVNVVLFAGYSRADIIFRPGPGLNDGTDNGSANAGKDTWTYGAGPASGSEPYIISSPSSTCNIANARSYIRFDLSSLPADVEQVFMGVAHYPHESYCYSNCNADFYFYPVTEDWNEMTLSYGTVLPEGSAVYGPINITFPNNLGNREYDITDIYRKWKDEIVANHGLSIYSPTEGCNNASVSFSVGSSDDPDASHRPYLRIVTPPPPSGLVSWWRGENNAYDSVGGNHGTPVNGATYASGEAGQAFSFDGVNDYVLIGDPIPAALQIQNEISLAAWVYTVAYPSEIGQIGLIMGSQYDTNFAGAAIHMVGLGDPNGVQAGQIYFQIGGDSSWHNTTTHTMVPLNQWVHIVATRKAGEDGKIYFNGALQTSTSEPWPSGNINYTGAWFAIGQQKDLNRPFNGLIDEVLIYNRALTALEVSTLANTKPDAFSFTAQTGVPLSTPVESTSITVSGISNPATISITAGGQYEINGSGTWSSTAGTVSPGATVKVRQTSSDEYFTTTTVTLTISGVEGTFSVTTESDTVIPNVTVFTAPAVSGDTTFNFTFTAGDTGSGVTGYCITETSSSAGCTWSATAPISYTAAEGSHTLYPWVRDGAGNESALFASPRTVLVDITRPAISAFSAPTVSDTLAINVTFAAGDTGSGVTGYCITETISGNDCSSWSATAPASFTFTGQGTRALYPWARDAAGNISPAAVAPVLVSIRGGDADGNGQVGIADALRTLRITVGLLKPTAAEKLLADVSPLENGIPAPDGNVGIADALLILRKVVGLVNF